MKGRSPFSSKTWKALLLSPALLLRVSVGNSIKKCLIAKEIDLEGCNNHNLVIDTLFAEVETHGVVIDTRSLW